MSAIHLSLLAAAMLVIGLHVGVRFEARRWRRKGDHDYMNTCESGGALYLVTRDRAPTESDIERFARQIAIYHGGKFIGRDDDGAYTIASRALGDRFGDNVKRYADRHWLEYTEAAEAVLNMPRRGDRP